MLAFVVAATVVAAAAAWTDFSTGHIPNWITLPPLAAAIVAHAVVGFVREGFTAGLMAAAISLGGAALCALIPGFMWWKGGMGGGDLKLFAAVGALCLPMVGIEAELYAFVVAAFIAPAQLAYRGQLFGVLKNSLALLFNPLRKTSDKRAVPPEVMTWFRLGPAIFVGMLLTCIVHLYDR